MDEIRQLIDEIEACFHKYDSIQLMGAIGLRLLANLPNMERQFYQDVCGIEVKYDEAAETIAEYAMNFGLSMPNDGKAVPTDEIADWLYNSLKKQRDAYAIADMPNDGDSEKWFTWIAHSNLISVRGDGYMVHFEEVFNEMFVPHTAFFEAEYGFSVQQFLDFCTHIEERIICKIGNQNEIYGASLLHERWKKWEEEHFGDLNNPNYFENRDFSKGMFGEFFEANPDVGHTEDFQQFLLFAPGDYTMSDRIFWVYPQNQAEANILEALSSRFGDNAAFIKEGEYKGNIMNGKCIFDRPILKDGKKYYCFTPLLVYRNLFLIAENLIKKNPRYYNEKFAANTAPESRDNYVERKVKSQFEKFLPGVKLYSSVTYPITVNGKSERAELDILGVSDYATYIIEVKAHELTHKDRVGIKGLKDKFLGSVTEACRQSERAKTYIATVESPVFGSKEGEVKIDRNKPVFKIAVTFQHYAVLLGHMQGLLDLGLMEEEHRNTWIVSLYDLMVVSDYCKDEREFLLYLYLHNDIASKNISWKDELDIFGQYLNNNLAQTISTVDDTMIIGGSEFFDEEYSKRFKLKVK